MTIAIATTKTGFDSTSDAVASATMMTFGNSVDTHLNNILNGAQAADRFLFSSAVTLTISNGAVDAPTQVMNLIAAGAGTTATLNTIGASNNRFMAIKAYPGHTISIASGAGNITTQDSNNITLTGNMILFLWCMGSQWSVVSTGGVKNNYLAGADPGTGDDTADGYDYGSFWLNGNNDRAFLLVNPALAASRWRWVTPVNNMWQIRAAAATLAQVGVAAPTIANTPANANGTDGTYVTLPTTASSGNLGGFVTAAFTHARLSYDPVIEWLIKTDSTMTTLRLWIGLASADVTNSDTASGSFIGFRYSTTVGEAGFVPVCRDGTTQSVGSALNAIAASTVYKLRLRIASTGTAAYFSVNDGAETAFATNIPAASTDLGMVCRPITTSAAIRLINFSYAKVSW